ncbi:MAG: preprotein translocase subunit YajC [Firmicutes bacterium]|nr:preprotein translocase subunit YajC [Bacillota bacterium]MCM1401413.1 preprotein translocase subunit YajC [Bacteroides sp.]MCM1477317.1 preprotein translocase subunit YajC [Bacteroides sp.]
MLSFILLQAPDSGLTNILMIVALIAIFYFFMIRPQQKKAKALKQFRESIKEGQKVVTAGGIYGKVKKIKETTFVVEIAPNVTITIDKGSVYESPEEVQNAQISENKQ